MEIEKVCESQSNVLDGTVYCYEPIPGEGVNVTIAGRDGQVYIVAFDMADLTVIHRAAEVANAPENRSASTEDLARITPAGMPVLMNLLARDFGADGFGGTT
ncbi:hypothetical protein [Mycolicibacterium fortuitum]|uniref:Uncharacterized protein n=1 Tax=Mycolicibacterium fortuitum TaxID=1766 RepID=A0AAE5AGC5_MYCFO|nr:hypothetical protein [Mycolicibacterium fortuitum]MDV7195785.1 hypothetical protein [Mycolicibacterium fortuitum]MDV7207654.1 hypothetical protein [Mycolicibacterium fortuitum]MDV7229710.1 hypothetical protein [Mycolicibacterium fortuitum]MDV7261537.1 hypothetical protein [Mycolicibacterium fortuitum]MDV7286683.1 hypothetical protein [Mycolicibacterium fortuitum]